MSGAAGAGLSRERAGRVAADPEAAGSGPGPAAGIANAGPGAVAGLAAGDALKTGKPPRQQPAPGSAGHR